MPRQYIYTEAQHKALLERERRLAAALDALILDTMHFAQLHHQAHHGEHSGTWLSCDRGLCPGVVRSISRAREAMQP